MASILNKAGTNVGNAYKLISASPLDVRFVVADIAERDSIVTENGCYAGLEVWVESEQKKYIAAPNGATFNWEEIATTADIPDISGKLDKTTYEWNKEIKFGSAGKLFIGSFPMYDSNLTITISATTTLTYHGVLVLATQNAKNNQVGVYTATVYNDAADTIAPNIYIERLENSNIYNIYFNPQPWSKNLVHIQAVGLNVNPSYGPIAPDDVTNICTSISEIPATATIKPTNALTNNFIAGLSSSTDNAIVRFNGTSGKKIQNSTVTIDDSGNTTLPINATLKLNTYGTRFLTLSGNNISADMSNETGGWAGAFASVKDPSETTTTMLGWYGSTSLTHIYMGGAYNDPYMKMTASGLFTFKNQVTINAAQGTAPLAVTSTTVNINLNADLLDGKHASDFQLAGNYLTSESDTLQTVTNRGNITTNVVKIQNGSASGAFVLGADVNAKTLTVNQRKLGRMGVPSYDSNGTKTIAGISFDSQSTVNYADFGGHPNNTASIAPDVIRFIVANSHDNAVNGARTLALQISKQDGLVDTAGGGTSVAAAKFFVPVQATSTITGNEGFIHGGLTAATGKTKNDYILLAGGSTKPISDFAMSGDISDFVKGPAYATNNAIAIFDGTTGKQIKNSGSTIDSNGYITTPRLLVTANSNTLTIGAQNASFCHIYNSANIPFIFNQGLQVTGNKDLGTSQYDWKDLYLSGSIKKVKSTTDTTTYTLTLPNKTGTIALTSDIPGISITDTGTKPIVGDITASGHTITVTRIGLDDLGLAAAYKYKGSVAKYENLPTTNQEIGDVWNIEDTGMNYAWTGSIWDSLGSTIDLSGYVTLNTAQTISGIKTFSAQPVISTANGLKFDSGNCKLRIYNTNASPIDYAAIEVRSNSTSTNRNLFIDLANNSLVVGAASGTADTTYKVNVKDTFNAATIYENGTSLADKYAAKGHDHDDIYLGKTTYEWNKEFAAGSNGAVSLGRYNLYDTQLTFDITTTTSFTLSGKLVIAAQNGSIKKVTIYGDASNTLASYITIYQSAITNNRSWVEVFCNFPGWSKNKVHIYGVALNSATVTNQMTSVTFTNGVPSGVTSGDAKWTGNIVNDITANCAAKNHTHDVNIATSTGANELTLAYGTKYALTAGGQSFIFTMPTDSNTTYGADRGISLKNGKFGHSNTAVTAVTTAGLYKIKYDAYGHITGTESFTLPTVNNGTLTIQKNGTKVATFTANQSGNTTANITVPTKVSELTNDSKFLTAETDTLQTVTTRGATTNKAITALSYSVNSAVTMEYDSSYKALKFVFA